MAEKRCDITELLESQCAHCKEPPRPKATTPPQAPRPQGGLNLARGPRRFRAEYDSTCPACEGDILTGQEIIPGDDGRYIHANPDECF